MQQTTLFNFIIIPIILFFVFFVTFVIFIILQPSMQHSGVLGLAIRVARARAHRWAAPSRRARTRARVRDRRARSAVGSMAPAEDHETIAPTS